MKTNHSKPSYGILALSRHSIACLQRAWGMIETPPPAMSLTPETIDPPGFPAQRDTHPRKAA